MVSSFTGILIQSLYSIRIKQILLFLRIQSCQTRDQSYSRQFPLGTVSVLCLWQSSIFKMAHWQKQHNRNLGHKMAHILVREPSYQSLLPTQIVITMHSGQWLWLSWQCGRIKYQRFESGHRLKFTQATVYCQLLKRRK